MKTAPEDISSKGDRRFRAPAVIFWVALALRVLIIIIGHTYRIRANDDHFDFGFEAGRIARSLVTGHGYGNPFNGWSGPTAWLAPVYPLLMALAFKLFGVYTHAAALFLMVVDSVASAAIAPAVYEIAARCFDARGLARRASKHAAPVALWSAWMWAVYPAALQYAVHWIWEMSVSACLFTWALVLALRLRGVGYDIASDAQQANRKQARFGAWAAFGLLWGLLALSNPSLLPCLPATIFWIVWPELGGGWRRTGWRSPRLPIGGVLLACIVFAVVLAPWVVRNERTLHSFVLTRSNFGVELYQSTLEANDGLPWGTAMPLWPGNPDFRRYVQVGEVEFARERGQMAMARIKEHPEQFWRWTLDRFLFFWDGTPHAPDRHPVQEYLRQLSYSFLSVCGLLGLLLMFRRRVTDAGLFALAFLLVPLPYYAVTVQPRFRHPLEPLIAVLGVYLFRSANTSRVWSWCEPN